MYAEVYETLRERIILSLEAVYAMGNNASNGFHIDTPLHELPHPSEIGAEVIVEHVKDSVPTWNAEATQHQSQNGDSKEEDGGYVNEKDEGQRSGKYRKVSQGKENWLQGEIVPNGNIMPDFVAPNLRLAVSFPFSLSAFSLIHTQRLLSPAARSLPPHCAFPISLNIFNHSIAVIQIPENVQPLHRRKRYRRRSNPQSSSNYNHALLERRSDQKCCPRS